MKVPAVLIVIVDVPAVNVKFVAEETVNAPVIVKLLAPKSKARAFVVVLEYVENVTVYPFVRNVPEA